MNCQKCLMPIKRISTGQKTLDGMTIRKWAHKTPQLFCKEAKGERGGIGTSLCTGHPSQLGNSPSNVSFQQLTLKILSKMDVSRVYCKKHWVKHRKFAPYKSCKY